MRTILAALALACALALSVCNPGLAQGVSPNQMFGCNQSAIYDASTNGSKRLVIGVAAKQIYVCGWDILAAGAVLLLQPQTFSQLTSCSGTIEGAIAVVSDSNTVTWGATIAGSGTNPVLAFCNGTNWTVAGK